MKTKQFDNAIKRKMEGIEPAFQESDWLKMQDYIHTHKPPSFWQKWGKGVFYTTNIVVIASLISTIIYQHYEKKTLLTKIDTLQQTLAANQLVITNSEQQALAVIDSLRHSPIKMKTIQMPLNSKAMMPTGRLRTKQQQIQANILPNEGVMVSYSLKNRVANQIVTQHQQKYQAVAQSNEGQTTPAYRTVSDHELSYYTNTGGENNRVNGLANETPNPFANNEVNVSALGQSNAGLMLQALASKPYVYKNLFASKNVTYTWADSANVVENTKLSLWESLRNISLRNVTYRAGVSIAKGNNSFDKGLMSEFLWHKHWAFNVGIEQNKWASEEFMDDKHFDYTTQKDFRITQAPTIPRNIDIKDIVFHTTIIRMPVALTYRTTMNSKTTLLMSVGTDFDLMAHQDVMFRVRPNRPNDILIPDPDHDDFKVAEQIKDIKGFLFNNISIMPGIEKRWGHLVVQALPYYSWQTKETPYFKDKQNYGVKLRVYYQFGK
jgi:hypothetical protein